MEQGSWWTLPPRSTKSARDGEARMAAKPRDGEARAAAREMQSDGGRRETGREMQSDGVSESETMRGRTYLEV